MQGIGYRAFAVDQATRIGLDGWIRTRADGSDEALVSGGREKRRGLYLRLHEGAAGRARHRDGHAQCRTAGGKGFRHNL